eukprot:COSAG03_NODE_24886_length_269_cov_0.611765_1_plen_21_part_10
MAGAWETHTAKLGALMAIFSP